jgi:BirA family biotin operon repressor/biotin-[acetyl-CoA-carboxylase] ligase
VQWRVERLGVVGSTNDLVLERARAGEPEGLALVAEAQDRGRGRHGRSWLSPPGNLYMSLLLRPRRPPEEIASLSLLCGLAACEAVAAATAGRVRVQLKWPNDLMVDGAKLGGILPEAEHAAGAPAVVVGLGLNVRSAPDLPDRPTVCLAQLMASPPPLATLLDELLDRFAAAYERWCEAGFEPFVAPWLASAHGLGATVELRLGNTRISGRFLGIDPRGRLALERPDGSREWYDAGELFFHTTPPAPLARAPRTG